MSEVAGRMAAQIGAQFLQKFYGGKGILLSGIPGVPKGNVTIVTLPLGTPGIPESKIPLPP